AELPRAEAFRRGGQLRSLTALMIAAQLAGVGLMAYVLVLLVLRPLARLSSAAATVAAGDLTVDLPAGGAGEVGYLTQVFNRLVARLRERESQAELERLSVTDALTGLYNRRHLMDTLSSEAQRSRRLRRPFSILLADVDHFKPYNDTHGHLAGDAALAKIAEILRQTTRAVDCVARYGGEEFLVVLLGVGAPQLRLGVHHDRPLPGHRLRDRPARNEQEPDPGVAGLNGDLVARVEEHERAIAGLVASFGLCTLLPYPLGANAARRRCVTERAAPREDVGEGVAR